MSNRLTTNVWSIDTASATPLTTQLTYVTQIRWVSEGASAGQNVSVTDVAGNVMWETCAAGSNNVEAEHIGVFYNGIVVPTLESGKLYITVGMRF